MIKIKECIAKNKKFFQSKIFWSVLFLKLLAMAYFSSHYSKDLFIPFIQYFIDSGFKNPWNEFVSRGILDAFPYSSTMLLSLTVPQWLGSLVFGSAAAIPFALQLFLLKIPFLLADLTIFLILCRWFETKWKYVILLFWCSPIIFYSSYVHGQIDSIPTAFLLISLWYTVSKKPAISGFLLGTGIAAKFNVAIAIPFILIYLIKTAAEAERKKIFAAFACGLSLALAILILPLLTGAGYRAIVLGTDRSRWIYDIFFVFKEDVKFYVAPGAALFFLIHFFNYEKFNRDLLVLYLGLILTTLVLLVPPAPGWFYWSIPFLTYFLIRQETAPFIPFWTFNIFYLVFYIFFDPSSAFFSKTTIGNFLNATQIEHGTSLSFTFMQSSLAFMDWWIYRVGVHSNSEYKLRQTPILIGMTGDSASGKHTLCESFVRLLGEQQILQLYGDDYHRWPRGHEEWNQYTHLDPRGNHIHLPTEHLMALKKGLPISKIFYDHKVGQFTSPVQVESNRFIIFLGLHTFLTKKMRAIFDLKIYMDPDESLRRNWKVQRDFKERGYDKEKILEELSKRDQDSKKYIHPQKEYADWIICYRPSDLNNPESSIKTSHLISSRHTQVEILLEAFQQTAAHLQVSWSLTENLEHQILEIAGTISQEQVQTIAYRLYPNLEDFMGNHLKWSGNLEGVTQLILLSFLSEIVHQH